MQMYFESKIGVLWSGLEIQTRIQRVRNMQASRPNTYRQTDTHTYSVCVRISLSLSLSLCVCVCARARARALCCVVYEGMYMFKRIFWEKDRDKRMSEDYFPQNNKFAHKHQKTMFVVGFNVHIQSKLL